MNLQETLEAMKLSLTEAQALASAEQQAKYDEGFKAGGGVISAPVEGGEPVPVSDKIYSQAEMDEKLEAAKVELKADILAKVQAQQTEEGLSEANLLEALK